MARLAAALAWSASPAVVMASIVATVAGGVAPPATAWLQRAIIDSLVQMAPGRRRLSAAGPQHAPLNGQILTLAVILGGLGLGIAIVPHVRRYAVNELRRGMGLLIQNQLYQTINSFPGLSRFESPAFFDQIQIVQRVSSNTASTLITSVLNSGQSLISAASFFVILEVINPVLAVIVGAAALPAIGAQLRNARRQADLEWRMSPALRRQVFYANLLSDPAAAKEVRLFGLGDFLRSRMLGEIRSINSNQRSLDRQVLRAESLLSLLAAGIAAGGLIWVVAQAAAGRLSVGDVTMFAISIIAVQGALSVLVTTLAEAYKSLALLSHYADIMAAGPDLPIAERPAVLPALRDGIELRDVWFRYSDQHPWVLQGVNMFIPRGGSAALVGLNGAGKSTLVKLLCRLYDPTRGAIYWDGIDIREVSPVDLRRRISTVFQDYMSYDLTAAENIGLGDVEHVRDRARICYAAEQAGVHDKLSGLPRGYDTMLSRMFFGKKDSQNPDTGVILSGGQWQKLAVARGLMRADRDLLILDEPSSGLDAEAEYAIHQRLCGMRVSQTSILISHRLSSVRGADVIYVLSFGQIAEQGSHADLMAVGGEYSRLFTLQGDGYRDQGSDDQEDLAVR